MKTPHFESLSELLFVDHNYDLFQAWPTRGGSDVNTVYGLFKTRNARSPTK